MNRLLVCLLGGLLLALPNAQAQSLPADRPPALDVPTGTEADVEDEAEFDTLLAKHARREPFIEASSDTRVFYTSNVLLLPDIAPFFPAEEDAVLAQTFDLRLHHRFWDAVLAELILRQQFIRYDEFDERDFDSQSAIARLSGDVAGWFTLHGGVTAQQEFLEETNHQFFRMFDVQVGAYRHFQLCPRAGLFAGYVFDWRPSTPTILSREDHTLYAGLTLALLDRLTAQVLYRLALQDSKNIDRFDTNQLVGLTLFFVVNDYVRLEAFANYTHNDSDIASRDYEVFDTGGALRLTFRY